MTRRLMRVVAAIDAVVGSLLLFRSGMTVLIDQVAWMRQLRLIFRFSTAASAAVLAIFMRGLAAGSWLLGRRADRVANPLALYGRLELGVAGSAVATNASVSGGGSRPARQVHGERAGSLRRRSWKGEEVRGAAPLFSPPRLRVRSPDA